MDSLNVTNKTALKVEEGSNNYSDNEQKMTGCLNIRDCILRKSTGSWKYAMILLANQGLATLAFFSVVVNLVVFLTRVIGQRQCQRSQ